MYQHLLRELVSAVNGAAIELMREESLDPNDLRNSGMIWQSIASQLHHLLAAEPTPATAPVAPVPPFVLLCSNQGYVFRFRGQEEAEDPIEVSPLIAGALPGSVNSPRLFQHLFKISRVRAESTRTTSGVRAAMALVCGVGMYNVGLALQRAACRDASSSSFPSLIKEAKKAYLESTDLINGLELSPDGTLVFAYMAGCNNMAELCTDDANQAKEFKNLVMTALWSIPPAKESRVYTYFALLSHVYAAEIGQVPPLPLNELINIDYGVNTSK